ncbi:hypothetical protein EDC04DRAFT_2600030 [Pisolithus marmoratus]|nr:hypothetical protein EDC04DRAFT_2600030 [Pisolithus marmoratus]
MRTTAGLPMESVSQPSLARSQAKHTRKCHQESQDGSGSEAIHWEPYPQLTRDLLAWILGHPADHAALFNEMIDQSTQGKPHSQRKKEINAVITDAIFCEDRQYGESYTSQPVRFASVVASHLIILKNKYQQHASRFKSTSEGINPNNLNYQNLHEQVLVEFPFWEECNQLWHGNPTYNARVFNETPGADWTGDFLAIIKSSGTTTPPVCNKSQAQEQGDPVGCLGSSANANWDPNPNILMDASELEEEEEEEEGEADKSQEGDWNMVSVSELVPEYCGNQGDFMLVNEQSGDHLPSQHQYGNSTGTFSPPDKPPSAIHCHTLSSDSQSTFCMAPYPRPPTSMSTTLSTLSSSTQHTGINSKTPQTSFTKGKNILAQINADLNGQLTGLSESSQDQCLLRATLKYEHKVMKTQAYMQEKEIAHLEKEHEREHSEVEKIHA